MRSPGWLTSLRAVPSRVRTALRGRSTASAGEVTRPARNTLAEPQAASRFDAARDAAARGAWTETLAALADGVPPAPLRFAWDSLYVSAALSQAAVEPDPVVVRQLRQAARDRATDAVRIGPAGSRRVTGLRFARGVACMDGRLDCPRADVVADFTWALLGPEPMRRDASRRLAALRRQPEARP
jgi:hypothetical protein